MENISRQEYLKAFKICNEYKIQQNKNEIDSFEIEFIKNEASFWLNLKYGDYLKVLSSGSRVVESGEFVKLGNVHIRTVLKDSCKIKYIHFTQKRLSSLKWIKTDVKLVKYKNEDEIRINTSWIFEKVDIGVINNLKSK